MWARAALAAVVLSLSVGGVASDIAHQDQVVGWDGFLRRSKSANPIVYRGLFIAQSDPGNTRRTNPWSLPTAIFGRFAYMTNCSCGRI
jgi:hypothetical protein